MRCSCCDRNLSDYESTLKHPVTGDYLDICRKCLVDIPIKPVESECQQNDVGYEEDFDDLVLFNEDCDDE
jgi:hypothetical protein